ncbi:MAG: hypothetical protein JWM32_59 [Verrucomicrobia bacterium]|nr:hypothetical protein [Verrucomicrobiota bacterium]
MASDREAETRSLTFAVFSADPIEGLAYRPHPKSPLKALQFYPTGRSPEYQLQGSARLILCDVATGSPRADVEIPPDLRRALLIVGPKSGKNSSRRLPVTLLDDARSAWSAGELKIINLSGLSLTGSAGPQSVALEPAATANLRVSGPANIKLRTEFSGRSYLACSETVSLKENERGLMILFPPYYPGSLEVQSRMLTDQ